MMDQKPRAVYYCRVSTDDVNQATSIVNQKEAAINVIEENQWILVDGYVEVKIASLIQRTGQKIEKTAERKASDGIRAVSGAIFFQRGCGAEGEVLLDEPPPQKSEPSVLERLNPPKEKAKGLNTKTAGA
ncbi:recombinase family protein [Lachnospiraceae bacterium 47-T17]